MMTIAGEDRKKIAERHADDQGPMPMPDDHRSNLPWKIESEHFSEKSRNCPFEG
jgi:hypothetical protein